jgi:hypothetical protein
LKRLAIVVLVILPLLYGGAEVAATAYAERVLAETAARYDPAASEVSADVSFPFLLGFGLRSSVDRVVLEIEHVDLGRILADRVRVVLLGVHLDRPETLRRREPVVESIDRLESVIELSATEVSKILPEGFRFEFSEDGARLLGPGTDAAVTFAVLGPGTIGFESASGPLPRDLPSSFEFSRIPLVACLDEVSLDDGLLKVRCAEDDPPARYPPDVDAAPQG